MRTKLQPNGPEVMITGTGDPPKAVRSLIGRCNAPGCDAVHLVLLDEDDEIICNAALPDDAIKKIGKAGGYILVKDVN